MINIDFESGKHTLDIVSVVSLIFFTFFRFTRISDSHQQLVIVSTRIICYRATKLQKMYTKYLNLEVPSIVFTRMEFNFNII